MKIKICGITNSNDANIAVNNSADAIGFIFYAKSTRFIEPVEAKAIVDQLPFFVLKIGVFVNESAETINRIAKLVGLNAIQLHGEEPPDIIESIILPVIKAFRVADNFDFSILDEYKNCTFLLDTFDPNEYGGTGKSFRWESIPETHRKNVILAGGISNEHIDYIASNIRPQAIDVSSSIEDSPGKKNHTKLIELLNKVNELRNI